MYRRHLRPAAKAFTMIELIVVIVVLAVLASLAIVGYQRVVTNAQDNATDAMLASVLREAEALAAFEDRPITIADIEAAAADLPDAAAIIGVAAAKPVREVPAEEDPCAGDAAPADDEIVAQETATDVIVAGKSKSGKVRKAKKDKDGKGGGSEPVPCDEEEPTSGTTTTTASGATTTTTAAGVTTTTASPTTTTTTAPGGPGADTPMLVSLPAGKTSAMVYDVDGDRLAGEYHITGGGTRGFVYDVSEAAFTEIAPLGGNYSTARGISGDLVVGNTTMASGAPQGFVFDLGATNPQVTPLGVGAATDVQGNIVVGYWTENPGVNISAPYGDGFISTEKTRAYTYNTSTGTKTDLNGYHAGAVTKAVAIDGDRVVGTTTLTGAEPVKATVWDINTHARIDVDAGNVDLYPKDIEGSVIAGTGENGVFAYDLTTAQLHNVGAAATSGSDYVGVSAGVVLAGTTTDDGVRVVIYRVATSTKTLLDTPASAVSHPVGIANGLAVFYTDEPDDDPEVGNRHRLRSFNTGTGTYQNLDSIGPWPYAMVTNGSIVAGLEYDTDSGEEPLAIWQLS